MSGLETTIISILLILSLCCVVPARALTLSSDDQAAREAALQWLKIVDSGNYKDAAQLMSEQIRGTRDWANYFAAHRAPLGRVKNRQISEVKHTSTVPDDPETRLHAIIRFKTSFELKSVATEEVVV